MNIIRLVSIVELIHFWSESGVHAVKLPRATMKHARDLCNFFFEPLSILVAVTIKPTIPSILHAQRPKSQNKNKVLVKLTNISMRLMCQKQPSCQVFLKTLKPSPYPGYREISSIKLNWPAPFFLCLAT